MTERQRAVREVMREFASQPFEYGVLDCARFTAEVARRITGRDYLAGFRYTNEAEANAEISRYGSLVDAARSVLGVASSTLEDGDPCVVDLPRVGQALGVWCAGEVIVKTQGSAIKVGPRYLLSGWNLCRKL